MPENVDVGPDIWNMYLVSLCVQCALFGLYGFLVVAAGHVIWARMRTGLSARAKSSSKLVLAVTILMFLLSTATLSFCLYRSFTGLNVTDNTQGVIDHILLGGNDWIYMVDTVALCLVTLIGDTLVLYQCFHIWSYYIVPFVVPFLLLLGELGTGAALVCWTMQMTSEAPNVFYVTICIYVFAIVQNLILSGLIIARILLLQRGSSAAGLPRSRPFTSLARMVGQTTLIHTTLLAFVTILFITRHTIRYAAQEIAVLAIGLNSVVLFWRMNKAALGYHNHRDCPLTSLHFRRSRSQSASHHSLPAIMLGISDNDHNNENANLSTTTYGNLASGSTTIYDIGGNIAIHDGSSSNTAISESIIPKCDTCNPNGRESKLQFTL